MNILKFAVLVLLILVSSCAHDLDDNLSANLKIIDQDIILIDSNLFNTIKAITNNEDRADQSIVCIDFFYTLTLFTLNSDNEYLSTTIINDDLQFSDFLENLDTNNAISISFPIMSILESGDT